MVNLSSRTINEQAIQFENVYMSYHFTKKSKYKLQMRDYQLKNVSFSIT